MFRFVEKITAYLLFCLFLVSFGAAQLQGQAQAGARERDPAKEQLIWQELQKAVPGAVETFKAATDNLDKDNFAESARLYDEVLKQAPNFAPAMRRLSGALVFSGKRQEGLALGRKVLAVDRGEEDLLSMAYLLITKRPDNHETTNTEMEESIFLVKEAIQKGASDPSAFQMLTQLTLQLDRRDEFISNAKLLEQRYPDSATTHYYKSIRLANEGDFAGAETAIKHTETLGLPHDLAQDILDAVAAEQDKAYFGMGRYFYYSLYALGIWALGLAALFAAGKTLSAKTLRSIENSDPNDITGGGQAGLRNIYKKVITAAGIYYYFSQPMMILFILTFTVWVVTFFLWMRWVPLKLFVVVVVVGLIGIFYILRSFFFRPKIDDPGRMVTRSEAPGLWELTHEVARTVGTRPVSEIRLTQGTDVAVYERGTMRAKMQDKADRVLILGAAVLNGFEQNDFRAVLAHEYGHFSNRDTAGGDIALWVNNHMRGMAEAMARRGQAEVTNFAFLFILIYNFIFRRITHGATRLQEILADRVAAYQFGRDAFRRGLMHVVRREVEFNHIASKELTAAYKGNHALPNLYEISEPDIDTKKNIDEDIDAILQRPTSEDDTHPSLEDRFKFITNIRSKQRDPLTGMVWDLFNDREGLTKEMNALLEQAVLAK